MTAPPEAPSPVTAELEQVGLPDLDLAAAADQPAALGLRGRTVAQVEPLDDQAAAVAHVEDAVDAAGVDRLAAAHHDQAAADVEVTAAGAALGASARGEPDGALQDDAVLALALVGLAHGGAQLLLGAHLEDPLGLGGLRGLRGRCLRLRGARRGCVRGPGRAGRGHRECCECERGGGHSRGRSRSWLSSVLTSLSALLVVVQRTCRAPPRVGPARAGRHRWIRRPGVAFSDFDRALIRDCDERGRARRRTHWCDRQTATA